LRERAHSCPGSRDRVRAKHAVAADDVDGAVAVDPRRGVVAVAESVVQQR